MVIDCKIVEMPPKLIVKEQSATARNLFERVDKSMQPFVISINPSKKKAMLSGSNEKTGEKHSMTIKKIVMMQPTDKMESVEFNTISVRLS